MRWKRRRLLWQALRKRKELRAVSKRTAHIAQDDILCFATVQNEIVRLPYFLDHHRRLGVDHFLIVDNASTDGTTDYLADQPDVSLWSTSTSYKAARFGMEWLIPLLFRYGHGHWCLTLDADECLVYPHCDTQPLKSLTAHLDTVGQVGMGAVMLDMYPKGQIGAQHYQAGRDPFEILEWFDAGPWSSSRQQPVDNLWLQGGARARAFFHEEPRLAPTMNKLPLIKWQRAYVYVNSTHSMLPPPLNRLYDGPGGTTISGALLHTKFLDIAVSRAGEAKHVGEHFSNSSLYDAYYDAVAANPDLHFEGSHRYTGWKQLEELDLIYGGDWPSAAPANPFR